MMGIEQLRGLCRNPMLLEKKMNARRKREVAAALARGFAALLLWVAAPWAASDESNPVEAKRTVIEMLASGLETAPVLHLRPGRMAALTFTDAEGAPWPVSEVFGGGSGLVRSSVRTSGKEHPHVVLVRSNHGGGSGSLIVLLEGLAAPVPVEIISDNAASTLWLDLRLTDKRSATDR